MQNRGALVRVQGAPGDTSSHVEMRLGEGASDPSSTWRRTSRRAWTASGVAWSRRQQAEADPYAIEAPPLPTTLAQAVDALEVDAFYRKEFGDTLVSYLVMMKRFEIGRYSDALAELPLPDGQDVSNWEMRQLLASLIFGFYLVPGRKKFSWFRLEVVAQAAVLGQGDQRDRRAPPHPAVGQLTTDDDRAGFGGGQGVAAGQGEPVRPGVPRG